MRLGIALSVCLLLHFMSYGLMMWAETIRSLGAFYQPAGEGLWAAIDPADIGAVW